MSAKKRIWAALGEKACRTPASGPIYRVEPTVREDLERWFIRQLEAAGGRGIEMIETDPNTIATRIGYQGSVTDTRKKITAADRREPGLLILESRLGVAENGAVWIDPEGRYPRAWLTLAEEIVVLLDRTALVPTMHEAYAALAWSDVAYGLFMAGPSKTADIEQALVIGAHGALGLTVVLQ